MSKADYKEFPIERTELPRGGFEEKHPSYGMVGIFTTQGQAHLFGSELPYHQSYITLRVTRATRRHDTDRDWYYGERGDLIEVALSPAQWASLISTPNVGSGVPCTLKRVRTGPIELYADPPQARTETQVVQENAEEAGKALAKEVAATRVRIEALLEGKVSRKVQNEVLAELQQVESKLGNGLPFFLTALREAAEKTVASAKAEVEAFVMSAVTRVGLRSLKQLGEADKGVGKLAQVDNDEVDYEVDYDLDDPDSERCAFVSGVGGWRCCMQKSHLGSCTPAPRVVS